MPKTVLLADDNATIHRLVELTFAGQDIRVQAVATGDQAIEAIERSAPDLVLADVGLPARSGYEVAQFVRSQSRLSSVPVLLVSGVLDQVDSARAQQVGADGVLTKPFDPAVLVARVTELLSGGRGRRGTAMPIESRAPQRPQTPQTPQTVPAPQSPPTAVNAAPAPTPLAAPTPGDAAQPIDSASPPLDAVSPAMPKADVPLDPSVPDERKADVDRYFEEIDRAFAELSKLPRRPIGDRIAPDVSDERSSSADAREPQAVASDVRTDVGPPTETIEPESETMNVAADEGREPVQLRDAFAALLEAERNGTTLVSATPTPRPATAPIDVDALASEVARRVVAQLSDRVVRDTVADIVSRTAERLVREEIDRIKRNIK